MKTEKINIIGTKLHFYLLSGLCFLLFASAATAQVRFVTRVQDKKVGKEDPFRVEYVIENVSEVSRFQEPEFPDFNIIQGPSQGSSTSIVNGEISQYIFVSYILKAKKTGKFTIPGAKAVINGSKVTSNSIQIEVVEGSLGPQPLSGIVPAPRRHREARPANQDLYLHPGEDPEEKIKNNLFVTATTDRSECYVGEPVVATFKLYTRLQSESKVSKRPSLNGFSVYDMLDPESPVSHTETYKGRDYNVYYIRKAQLYPLQPGTVTIDPAEVENKVVFYKAGTGSSRPRRPGSMDDFIREFFEEMHEPSAEPIEEKLTVSTKPLTVSVLPLPAENKPADFGGAVGNFTIHSRLAGGRPETGKASRLIVTIEGEGNLPMVTAPSVEWPESFEVFDPTVREEADKSVSPIKGRKIFEYVFTPNEKGDYTIPGVSFSYFNPREKKYHTVQSESISLSVIPGVGSKSTALQPVAEAPKVEEPFMSHSAIIQLLMGVTLLLIAVIGYLTWFGRKREKTEIVTHPVIDPLANMPSVPVAATVTSAEPVVEPAAAVTEVPSKQPPEWKPVEEAFVSGNSQQFYTQLGNTLWQFFGERMGLKGSEKNKALLLQKLQAKGVGSVEIFQLKQLLEGCELALYAGVGSAEDMQNDLVTARNLVSTLNDKI